MGETQANKTDDAVQLMTLHSAKGLEFKTVLIVGMEESLFPHARSVESINELEEERRLCYVGITRARKRLFLTYTEYRRLYGRDSYNPPSRFITEIPDDHIEFIRPKQSFSSGYYGTVAKNNDKIQTLQYALGDNVVHSTFGEGVVLNIEGDGDSSRIQVSFHEVGTKWLVSAYANLKRI